MCVADARLRKGIYTPKGVRGVYTYTGSHSKTALFNFGDLAFLPFESVTYELCP